MGEVIHLNKHPPRPHRGSDEPPPSCEDEGDLPQADVLEVRDNGDIVTVDDDGAPHATGKPAITCPDGATYHYQHGAIHRDGDMPAYEHPGVLKVWAKENLIHRSRGPAVVWSDGEEQWRVDGELHRDDGPAWTRDDGLEVWARDGKLHREGKRPSVLHPNGFALWATNGEVTVVHYPNGFLVVFENFRVFGTNKALGSDVHHLDVRFNVATWSTRLVDSEGRTHRDGGVPAVFNADGSVEYWQCGERAPGPGGKSVELHDGPGWQAARDLRWDWGWYEQSFVPRHQDKLSPGCVTKRALLR
jgi:hypothetical protein